MSTSTASRNGPYSGGGVLGGVGQDRHVLVAVSSRASRMATTWPSIIPEGATTSAPASAWATAARAYRSMVASLSTRPSAVSTPQWPWSVYSSRQRSAMSTRSSPTSSRRSARAACTMPSGFQASEPSASLPAGMPKRITAGMPRSASCGDLLAQRLPRVLHHAGQRGDRLGLVDALPHEERARSGRRPTVGSRPPAAAAPASAAAAASAAGGSSRLEAYGREVSQGDLLQ